MYACQRRNRPIPAWTNLTRGIVLGVPLNFVAYISGIESVNHPPKSSISNYACGLCAILWQMWILCAVLLSDHASVVLRSASTEYTGVLKRRYINSEGWAMPRRVRATLFQGCIDCRRNRALQLTKALYSKAIQALQNTMADDFSRALKKIASRSVWMDSFSRHGTITALVCSACDAQSIVQYSPIYGLIFSPESESCRPWWAVPILSRVERCLAKGSVII